MSEKTKVAFYIGEKGNIEGSTLLYWEDAEMLHDLQEEGALIVEVDEDLPGDLGKINNLAEILHKMENADDLSCGDSSLLSDAIPCLIIKALKKTGRL